MKTIEGYTYKVGEWIGKGYSSTVHKGIRDKTGEQVSIKVIEMGKLQDPINQMLLQMQVSALKSLTASRHVLHLYDVYATRNNTYLVTELCDGDLSTLIKQRRTLPYFEAVQIMRQLINGYYDIHRAGYLHRDIKPANIFHKNGIYKYGDFGFAVPISDIHNHRNYNVGSPVYMPPQALKENIYSVSCDVWALGIIFFQLLKGSVPWRAISEKVLYDKMISEPIETLSLGLPEVARRFIGELLSLEPKMRPTPEQLLNWPSQLQSAPIQPRIIAPYQTKGKTALTIKQVNYTSNTVPAKQSNFYFSTTSTLSPQHSRAINPLLNSKEPSAIQVIVKEGKQHDEQYKQCYFFANNSINYVKFMHRVLKFLTCSTQVPLQTLILSITRQMFKEMDLLTGLLEGHDQNAQIKIDFWRQFLKSPKCQSLKKKVKKYQSKYRMFHEQGECQALNERLVLDGINDLMSFLDGQENFKPKIVVGADYLTTLYQLLHLRTKYDAVQFMKLSKIDLIMQGNPYNTSREHLEKLRKKLLLIRP